MRLILVRTLAGILFSSLTALAPASAGPRIDRVEIVEYGIVEVTKLSDESAPGVATGTLERGHIKIIKQTKTIPLRKNIAFGYRFKAYSADKNAILELRDINIVPPPGLKNPKTGNILMQEEGPQEVRSGDIGESYYVLRFDWTLLPGVWKFQLLDGERKLSEIEFTLVKE